VTYDSTTGAADVIGINAGGNLRFAINKNTRLRVGTLLVLPEGTLEIGTPSTPIPASFSAEIIFKNKPLDSATDPNQYGTGLLSINGKVTMHGGTKSPTFVRLGREPRARQRTLQLQQAVSGWQPGDRLILPDTRHLRASEVKNWKVTQPQWEELIIQSMARDGRTLTLTQALTYDHLGARDGDGNLDFLPHVGNLSRNVVIRSEHPIGSGRVQGHIFFTSRANVDIRYALFRDLGRTRAQTTGAGNHIGRYPIHMHHVMGPVTTPSNGYQFTLIGNAVDGGSSNHNLRWGIAVHDSHYGLIQDNVVYNYNGFLIGTEDGSESYNVFDHNFVVRSNGAGGRAAGGNEGGGFWFRGPNNYIRNNVAANLMSDGPNAAYGFTLWQSYLGTIKVPNFKGADTSVSGQYTTKDGNALPVLEFSGNEVYGATGGGLTYWWIGTFGRGYPRATQDTIFKNLHIWHVFNAPIFHYQAMRIIHDGLIIRGKDPASNPACCGTGVTMMDYAANGITFRNVNIQGMKTGIEPSTISDGGLQKVENSYLRNLVNFRHRTIWTSAATSSWVSPRKVIIRNTHFAAWPGNPLTAIQMVWDPTHFSSTNTTQRDELFVYNYQGQLGNNFRVYYLEQANQNIAGGRALCSDTTTRPEIRGITCPFAGTTTVLRPTPPFNLRIR
jgi:hypothetical protein